MTSPNPFQLWILVAVVHRLTLGESKFVPQAAQEESFLPSIPMSVKKES
jgi:hypothetical protein